MRVCLISLMRAEVVHHVLVPLKNLKALSYQHKITAEEIFDPKRKLGFLQCFAKKHNEVIQQLVRPFNQPEPPLPLEEPMDAATEGEPLPLEDLIDAATEVVDTTYQEELMEASKYRSALQLNSKKTDNFIRCERWYY